MLGKSAKWEFKPENAIAAALIYLILAWGFSYMIDIHNFLGFHRVLFSEDIEIALVWFHLFKDGSLTEWLQWIFLGSTAFLSSHLGGRLISSGHHKPATFWMIMGVAAVLMFIEDAFNTRYFLAEIANVLFGTEGYSNPVNIMAQIFYFVILGSIPMYALIRYWRYIWSSNKTRFYIIFGFVGYGVAVAASGTRLIKSWYGSVGEYLIGVIAQGAMRQYDFRVDPEFPLGHYLMDLLLEESLELLSAAALFAAAIAYFQDFKRSPTIASSFYKGKFWKRK